MDPQDNLTVSACIAGLLAFGHRAIPFQLFVTRWGHPVSELVPGSKRKKVRERRAGPQDVPRTVWRIRDEFVSITASLLLIQKEVGSANLSIDVEVLKRALTECVTTYAEFEKLHVISSQKEEIGLPGEAWGRSFTSPPMDKILTSLSYYSEYFHFAVERMKSESLKRIPVDQQDSSKSRLDSEQTASQPISEVSLPIKLSEISNKYWYILDIKGKAKLNLENESASRSPFPFPATVGTTGLPPSKLFGVPSETDANYCNWPADPKVQYQQNLRIEEDLKIQDDIRRKQRDIVLMGDYDSIPLALKNMRKAHHIDKFESSTENLKHEVFNYLLRHLELVVREIDKRHWEKTLDVKTNDFEYFFQDISRIFEKDYEPTLKNLQQLEPEIPPRIWKNILSTSSVNSRTYNFVYIRSPCCGGRKWRQVQHLLEDVTAILYLVDVNKYDEVFEDVTETSLHHSLQFFASIARAPLFQKCEIVLFFTNIDEFRKKVESGNSPIKKFFLSFDDFYEDGETGLQFFARLFGAEHKTEGRILSMEYTYPNDPKILERLDQCVNCSLAERARRKEHPQRDTQT